MKKQYVVYVLCLILGFAGGALYFVKNKTASNSSANTYGEECPFSHINPLRCGDDQPEQVEYSVFKKELLEKLSLAKERGNLSEAALYFRDLNNGPTFYFNEQSEFAPMSLLKLPMMVAVYKYVENDPAQLEEKLRTPAVFGQNSQIMESSQTLAPDTEYTIDEIVYYMIVHSDNRAIDMLAQWLDTKGANHEVIRRTLSDLGIIGYEANLVDSKITVKQYASIFRILYNASYLNPLMSEKALNVLSQTEFKDGLVGRLPKNIKVAHKFGVRAYNQGEQQLHDCGIVYFEPSPYMICIMTRGDNYAALSEYIQQSSKQVFEEVKQRTQ